MKITSQSADELTLTEGSTSGIVVGAALIIVGGVAGYVLRAATPYALYIGLAAAAIGIAIILFSSSITVVANKKTGQLAYEKKRLVGAQNSTFKIVDVFRIETRKSWRVDNSPNQQQQAPQLVAQSVIVFKNGSELALDHQKTSSNTQVGGMVLTGGQANESATAAQVASFLGVPFQEVMPPNMGSGVNIRFES